jgi:hypothetical protein
LCLNAAWECCKRYHPEDYFMYDAAHLRSTLEIKVVGWDC